MDILDEGVKVGLAWRQPDAPIADRYDPILGITEKTRIAFAIPASAPAEKVVCLSCGGHFHRNPDGSIPCGH